jgi:hypothetical protein
MNDRRSPRRRGEIRGDDDERVGRLPDLVVAASRRPRKERAGCVTARHPEIWECPVPIANLVGYPRDSLSREALWGVIEEFVTHAGTD